MSASYNPLQTEDQQIEADAAYARRLQAEERRSATTRSPLHDVSEISRNHAAAPQFPQIPSPAKLVEGLSREQTAGAVFAAFVAVKLGLGPAFAQLTCVALGLAVFRVARKVANLDDEGAFRAAFSASLCLAFVIACVGVTAADVCALLALGAAATKPQQSSFTGDALKTVLKAERKATRGPKPRDFWGKLTRKFTSAVDDFFATLQDRAADVRFYDCDLFMVCKVTPPGADAVWLVGAFYKWHNANAVAVYVNRWLADFASAHAAATRRWRRMTNHRCWLRTENLRARRRMVPAVLAVARLARRCLHTCGAVSPCDRPQCVASRINRIPACALPAFWCPLTVCCCWCVQGGTPATEREL